MSAFRIYFKLVAMTIASQMAYRKSFFMMAAGHFVVTFSEFVGVYALFKRFHSINGWTVEEVAVFYGFIHIAFAFAESIGRGYDKFHEHVQYGSFDRMLLRPRSLFLQIMGSELQLMRVGRLLQGICVFYWGISQLQISLNLINATTLAMALLGAIMLFIGLMVFQATLSFWSVQSLEVVNVFTYGGVQTAQYPMDIYSRWFQRFFLFIVPIGCVSYFPIVAVLRSESTILGLFSPISGIIFFATSLLVFRFGVKHYTSTGS